MSNELKLTAADSVPGLVRGSHARHAPPVRTPCANCATPLRGPWCHACGQSAEDLHRSILRLIAEVLEGLLHADGRLWRTLPDLMLRPGVLTRAYLDGHRAPQIPPLRLFLVVLLSIFVVGGLTGGVKPLHINQNTTPETKGRVVMSVGPTRTLDQLTPDERARLKEGMSRINLNDANNKTDHATANWLQTRLNRTLDDPERFYLILEQWSERFAILMLPVSAVLLSLLFIFQRRFFLFDHTIFSLHSLSATGILITLSMALSSVVQGWGFALLLPAPFHLYAHMRQVYRTSLAGALIRMALLFLGSIVAAALLIVGLLAVGLNGMAA